MSQIGFSAPSQIGFGDAALEKNSNKSAFIEHQLQMCRPRAGFDLPTHPVIEQSRRFGRSVDGLAHSVLRPLMRRGRRFDLIRRAVEARKVLDIRRRLRLFAGQALANSLRRVAIDDWEVPK